MNNAYIMDVLLLVLAGLFIVFTIRFIKSKIHLINRNDVDSKMLSFVMAETYKPALVIAFPFLCAYSFTIWRTAELMRYFGAWGYGAIGILSIFSLVAAVATILSSFLLMATSSRHLALKYPDPEKDGSNDNG